MSVDTLAKFGQDIIPACRCFQQDDQGIDEAGLLFIGEAMQLGNALMGHLGSVGACPTAAPALLAIAIHTAVFEVATARAVLGGEDTGNPYTLVDAMEEVNDEVSRHLRTLRARPRELMRKAAN